MIPPVLGSCPGWAISGHEVSRWAQWLRLAGTMGASDGEGPLHLARAVKSDRVTSDLIQSAKL